MSELTPKRLAEIGNYSLNISGPAFEEYAKRDLPMLVAEVERLNDELKGATLLDESNVRVCRALQADLSAAQKRIEEMETSHAGDCSIYSALMNGNPEDGICTCGYGWSLVRKSDPSQMYSEERLAAMLSHQPVAVLSEPPADAKQVTQIIEG